MSSPSAALRHPPSADEAAAGTLLALAVHAVLLLGLALGVNWRSHAPTPVSAELWAAVPRVAAPEAPPEPPAPKPPPPVPTPVQTAPPPAPPAEPDAQIITEKKAADTERADEKAAAAAREAERRRKEEAARKQQQEEARARQREEQARLDRLREENLRRLAAQLPGSAPASSTGTDTQDAAPSAAYAGRIRARIFPNILFTDPIPGKAIAEVQVSVAADGRITGRKLARSSGVAAWDDAVLRAIDRTAQLPLDEGRAPPPSMLIEFDAAKR